MCHLKACWLQSLATALWPIMLLLRDICFPFRLQIYRMKLPEERDANGWLRKVLLRLNQLARRMLPGR